MNAPTVVAPAAPAKDKFEQEWEAVGYLDNHKLVCRFDVDGGERETRWEPGYPPSIMLTACYLYDADILQLLAPETVAKIEAEAGEHFTALAYENEADAHAARRESNDDAATLWELQDLWSKQ